MNKDTFTPKLAAEVQDNIFRNMTAHKKIKMVGQFFRFGKKLNSLNGNRRITDENSRDIKTS